jgi:hypothetical protein
VGESGAGYLREMIEVTVACAQGQLVLEDQRCDPEIMDENGLSLAAKVAKQGGVMTGGLLVREQRRHAGLREEPVQHAFVLGAASSRRESGSQLGEDHEGQEHGFGVSDQRDDTRLAAAQVRVGIRVEGQLQRQRRLSIRC